MAPKSERARHSINVCPKHGETGNEPCAICYPPPDHIATTGKMIPECSEVVERLAKAHDYGLFDRAATEKILIEWRERRVQELEEALRELKPGLTGWMHELVTRVLG